MKPIKKNIPKQWLDIITSTPGYDPLRDAGDCIFLPDLAQHAIDFYPLFLSHIKGPLAGKPFELQSWEKAIIANLFGWYRPDRTRRYREAFIYVPRKQGKTTLTAGIVIQALFMDDEPGAEIYSAAGDREQAAIVFEIVREMVLREPYLAERCKVYQRSIVHHDGGSYKAISAEADTKFGYNPHVVVVDELHVQRDDQLVNALKTGMGARTQPLMIYITTADYWRESICNQTYQYACSVRDGIIKNAAFLPVIYEASKGDDWKSPKTWEKANPNFNVTVPQAFYDDEVQKAVASPAYENHVKRFYLNVITEQAVRWLSMDLWDSCSDGAEPALWRKQKLAQLRGKQCWAGLDLGSVRDLTALVFAFPNEDNGYDILPYFWVPKDSARLREERDFVPYTQWIRDGFAISTPGDAMDYDLVKKEIVRLSQEYGMVSLAIDRAFQGDQLMLQLANEGLDVAPFGQGYLSMAAPTRKLNELVIGSQLDHGNNPILRWMASNVVVMMDEHENLKMSKKRSTERIDGMVALAMALGQAQMYNAEAHRSIYDVRGVRTL